MICDPGGPPETVTTVCGESQQKSAAMERGDTTKRTVLAPGAELVELDPAVPTAGGAVVDAAAGADAEESAVDWAEAAVVWAEGAALVAADSALVITAVDSAAVVAGIDSEAIVVAAVVAAADDGTGTVLRPQPAPADATSVP